MTDTIVHDWNDGAMHIIVIDYMPMQFRADTYGGYDYVELWPVAIRVVYG